MKTNNFINYDYVVEYLNGLEEDASKKLSSLKEEALNLRIPIITKECENLLKFLIKLKNPKKILEIGSGILYSTLLMEEFSSSETKIFTIEYSKENFKRAEENRVKYNSEKIEILFGDANEIIPDLEEKFDFVFIDAAKGQYKNFFKKLDPLVEENGLIISDNVLFRGMVCNDDLTEKRFKTIVERLREYLDYITHLEGYFTTVVPVSDGIALTIKEEK